MDTGRQNQKFDHPLFRCCGRYQGFFFRCLFDLYQRANCKMHYYIISFSFSNTTSIEGLWLRPYYSTSTMSSVTSVFPLKTNDDLQEITQRNQSGSQVNTKYHVAQHDYSCRVQDQIEGADIYRGSLPYATFGSGENSHKPKNHIRQNISPHLGLIYYV